MLNHSRYLSLLHTATRGGVSLHSEAGVGVDTVLGREMLALYVLSCGAGQGAGRRANPVNAAALVSGGQVSDDGRDKGRAWSVSVCCQAA